MTLMYSIYRRIRRFLPLACIWTRHQNTSTRYYWTCRANPIKKQYGREQIACLIFIAVTKSALSLDDVKNLFDLQKNKYSIEEAYTYFAGRFDMILNENEIMKIKPEEKEKALLENIILTVVSNIHLHKLLEETFGNKV